MRPAVEETMIRATTPTASNTVNHAAAA